MVCVLPKCLFKMSPFLPFLFFLFDKLHICEYFLKSALLLTFIHIKYNDNIMLCLFTVYTFFFVFNFLSLFSFYSDNELHTLLQIIQYNFNKICEHTRTYVLVIAKIPDGVIQVQTKRFDFFP